MSYEFGMFFKQCKDFNDAMSIANQFVSVCRDKANEMFDIEKYYIPSISRRKEGNELTNEYWLFSLFNFRFIYWKEYNLLGICGDRYPEAAMELFDTHHDFQNSCDQNYDFESWSDKIDVFTELKSMVLSLSDSEFCDIFIKEDNYYTEDDRERIMKDISYYKKSYLYEKIYSTLALEAWLYGNNDSSFSRITLNAIDSTETQFKLNIKLKCFIDTLEL